MTIIGLDQVPSSGGQVSSKNKDIMGKEDFLHLLVAQLQAQDPLNPMDSTGFTAQLAEFSSLEQLQNVNSNLEGISTSQAISTNSQAVDFIGKTVTAVGNSITVQNGTSSPLQIIYISVYDQYGNFIRDLEVGALPAGQHTLSWDALDYLGGQVPDGSYRFEVNAIDAEGNSVATTAFTSGTVTGVNFEDGLAYLIIGDEQIPMGNVVQVLSANTES
jgi:flagellar basal-body rod modification protein FlgD